MTQPRAQAAEPSFADVLAALRNSHERFVASVAPLTDDQLAGRSYASEWTIAQVASHLGSGAEIFRLHVSAGDRGEEPAGNDTYVPIWDTWNAREPLDQVRDAVATEAAFLDDVGALSDEERERWHLDLFGMSLDLAGLLALRLNEHALHTWDVTVSFDPASTVPEDATTYVLDALPTVAAWAGKPSEQQVSVEVRTTSPERAFHLDLGPGGVSLTPSLDDTDATAVLTLPAEAFVRLVYGRLDADHTPDSVTATGVDLDLLRTVFPGL